MVKKDKIEAADVAYDSVWDAICDTPEDAENMRLRSEVMIALEKYIKENGLTQKEAARRFGVTQPRVSELVHRKFSRFSLDSLLSMAARAGLYAEITLKAA